MKEGRERRLDFLGGSPRHDNEPETQKDMTVAGRAVSVIWGHKSSETGRWGRQ